MGFDLRILKNDSIPKALREIPEPPKKLYLAGKIPPENFMYLAVVGSRRCTTYGRDAVAKLISGLKGYPIAIVSGLATGIDALSHIAALEAGLPAVAFPGSGISDESLAYSPNRKLINDILGSGGCLLSEFEPETRAAVYTFPRRNRLVAGISRAALIVEAEERSGTLITARLALEYNREVLAVPGPISSLFSKGTNRLIREGAVPITEPKDILEALGFNIDENLAEENRFADATPLEKKILKTLKEPMPKDELIRSMNISPAEINAALSLMEIKGFIKEELGEIRAA